MAKNTLFCLLCPRVPVYSNPVGGEGREGGEGGLSFVRVWVRGLADWWSRRAEIVVVVVVAVAGQSFSRKYEESLFMPCCMRVGITWWVEFLFFAVFLLTCGEQQLKWLFW